MLVQAMSLDLLGIALQKDVVIFNDAPVSERNVPKVRREKVFGIGTCIMRQLGCATVFLN